MDKPYILPIEVSKPADTRIMTVTPAGWDVIRAVVLRWMEQADKGYDTAREMAKYDKSGTAEAQMKYFGSAASFLCGCISRLHRGRYRIDDLIRLLHLWPEDKQCPPAWEEHWHRHQDAETSDVTLFPSQCGGRSDCNGGGGPGQTDGPDKDIGEVHSVGNRPDRTPHGGTEPVGQSPGPADRGKQLGGEQRGQKDGTGRKPTAGKVKPSKRTGNKGPGPKRA